MRAVCILVSMGFVWISCARVCFCVSKMENAKGIFHLLLLMAARGEEGSHREMKVEVCMKGLFPW